MSGSATPDCEARARTIIERALDRLAAVLPHDPDTIWMMELDEPDYVNQERLEPQLRSLLARRLDCRGRTSG